MHTDSLAHLILSYTGGFRPSDVGVVSFGYFSPDVPLSITPSRCPGRDHSGVESTKNRPSIYVVASVNAICDYTANPYGGTARTSSTVPADLRESMLLKEPSVRCGYSVGVFDCQLPPSFSNRQRGL